MAESTAESQGSPNFEETSFLSRKGLDDEFNIKRMLTSNENLLWDLREQRDADASRQVELLQAIRDELACRSTPLQFICNAILQTVYVAVAILFGMFAVYSWSSQVLGNFQSLIANNMNMVIFCMSNNSVRNSVLTSRKPRF
jgi:hypothetical protein